jgi:predicted GNAT superfamily acetyltransferase
LESRNAYLNIAKLGGMARMYLENVYGNMEDELNFGIPSDRFEVEWWINTPRVVKRLNDEERLSLKHYEDGGIISINTLTANAKGLPVPERDRMDWLEDPSVRPALTRFQIPANFQAIRKADPGLAMEWRMYTRTIFTLFFSQKYIVTDFLYVDGDEPRSYYVLSEEAALERVASQKLP